VGQVASCYTLLTVAVAGREYKVLYADLASPLLTCDTFLVHETKVANTYYAVGDYSLMHLCSNCFEQYQESLKAPWLLVNAQVKRLFATEDPDVAEWQEGR
jgi:hypothetical protein